MKLIIGNPYDYNYIALKNNPNKLNGLALKKTESLPSPDTAKMNVNAKFIGQYLGVNTTHDWSQYYSKIWDLYNWSKVNTKSEDINKLISFLQKKLNEAPAMNGKRIDDLHIAYRLDAKKEKPAEKLVEKKEELKENSAQKKVVEKVKMKTIEKEAEVSNPVQEEPSMSLESVKADKSYSPFREVKDLLSFTQQYSEVQKMLGGAI